MRNVSGLTWRKLPTLRGDGDLCLRKTGSEVVVTALVLYIIGRFLDTVRSQRCATTVSIHSCSSPIRFHVSLKPQPTCNSTGGLVVEATVRTHLIVVLPPLFDLLLGVLQRQETMLIEALLPQSPIERLNECVIGWLTRSTKIQLDLLKVCPAI